MSGVALFNLNINPYSFGNLEPRFGNHGLKQTIAEHIWDELLALDLGKTWPPKGKENIAALKIRHKYDQNTIFGIFGVFLLCFAGGAKFFATLDCCPLWARTVYKAIRPLPVEAPKVGLLNSWHSSKTLKYLSYSEDILPKYQSGKV